MEAGRVSSVASTQGYGEGIIFTVFAAAVIGGVSCAAAGGTWSGLASGVILLSFVQNLLDLENAPNYWIDAIDGGVILFALILARVIGGEAAAEWSKITGLDTFDVRFPTSRDAVRLGRDERGAGLLGRVRRGADRRDGARRRGAGRARVRVHDRPRQRGPVRATRRARAVPGRPGSRRDHRRAWRPVPRVGDLYRRLVTDSPLHWLGPACGVIHMATGAVLNACWDLAARRAGMPLWLLLASLSPAQLATSWTSATWRTRSPATRRSDYSNGPWTAGRNGSRRCAATATLRTRRRRAGSGTPTSSSRRLCEEAVSDGFRQVKVKVGGSARGRQRRLAIARDDARPGHGIAIDANQVWDVPRRSGGCGSSRTSGRRGSRSRPAPTTSWGMPRSGAPSPRSGSPPASTSPTG